LAIAGCGPKASESKTAGAMTAEPPAELAWAYPKAAQTPLPSVGPGSHTTPGSHLSFTEAQLNDDQNPVDWAPDEHPPAPDIVAHGHKDGPTPCAECHLFNGAGFEGAPSLAGLAAAYIVQQVKAFRSGERRSAEQDKPSTREMIGVATKVSDAELAQAAAYFAGLRHPSWYRVVETDQVPVTRPNFYGWRDLVPGGGTEPIAGRVIEVPEDPARMFMADPHSGIVVYAPKGALARGEAIASAGGGSGLACKSCHGADLRGAGDTPSLAGRSPAYLARMLWDIRSGARGGPSVAAMQGPAKGLGVGEITDVAAYLASLKP
jgi:cytochrome c553